MSTNARNKISQILENHGLDHHGWAPLQKPLHYEAYHEWLESGLAANMEYLKTSARVKKNPSQHFAPMRSILSLTEDYFPAPPHSPTPLSGLKVAHYARQDDYHHWLRDKLVDAARDLKVAFPDEEFLAFTDAVPLLERAHAYQAGLGWVGKNTCLIHPKKGSLFFIAEILTTLECSSAPSPMTDHCGTCTRCIDACPTGALSDKRLDANTCIAYWNIEEKTFPPESLRPKIGSWFFGCDICQTVCPWNIKLHKDQPSFPQPAKASRDTVIKSLRWILTTSNKQLMKTLGHTPLNRAGGRGLKRNALIVIANENYDELLPQVKTFVDHPRLSPLAAWVAESLTKSP